MDGQTFLTKITAEFDRVVQAAEHGLPTNRFATIKDGRLKLKKRDAMPVSRRLRALRTLISTSLPKVRIEDLLQDVDERCHFIAAFQPLSGYQPRNPDSYLSLLATLIAHGTNLGLAAMSQSVDTLTADALQDTSRWLLREATLKAANTILVNHHHGQTLSAVWGDGRRSSSDGQRFAVERKSLLGSVYPRYFGYYDRALQLYTHTSGSAQRLRHPGHLLHAARGRLCSWRHSRQRHGSGDRRTHLRHQWLHRAPVWSVRAARDQLSAQAEGFAGSGAQPHRSRCRLWRVAAVAAWPHQHRPHP
jgi:hypothetical protein